jgi:hypothetical protein
MWCKNCRQDVPAVAGHGPGRLGCIRCGTVLTPDVTAHNVGVAEISTFGLELGHGQPVRPQPRMRSTIDSKPPVDLDEWSLDGDLGDLEPLISARRAMDKPVQRFDAAPLQPLPAPAIFGSPAEPTPTKSRPDPSLLAWSFFAIGLMAFMCGVVLLIWSFAEGRSELWGLGMPITVGGQVALLLGLVLQLERIWQGNRQTVDRLEQVDAQLGDLKQQASLMNVNQSGPSHAFYSHLAGGAPPQMLLADLKSQLDMLAVRMADRR